MGRLCEERFSRTGRGGENESEGWGVEMAMKEGNQKSRTSFNASPRRQGQSRTTIPAPKLLTLTILQGAKITLTYYPLVYSACNEKFAVAIKNL